MDFECFITDQQLGYDHAKMFSTFAGYNGKNDWRMPTGSEAYAIREHLMETEHEYAGDPIWDSSLAFTTDIEMLEQQWYRCRVILVRPKDDD